MQCGCGRSLRNQWEKSKQNAVFITKKEGTYKFKVIDEVLYRIFQNKLHEEVKQIVVPEVYRKQVMKLAHESIVGGHLGAKTTVDCITSNFHWAGVVADVTRFCRSCDICQKTAPKGRACKIPLFLLKIFFYSHHAIKPLAPTTTVPYHHKYCDNNVSKYL